MAANVLFATKLEKLGAAAKHVVVGFHTLSKLHGSDVKPPTFISLHGCRHP